MLSVIEASAGSVPVFDKFSMGKSGNQDKGRWNIQAEWRYLERRLEEISNPNCSKYSS
jgi:hypothetical protein